MQPELNFSKAKYFGDKEKIAEEEAKIFKKYKYNPFVTIIPTFVQLILLMCVIEVIKSGIQSGLYNMSFAGISLSIVPSKAFGIYILMPIFAAISSLAMCICQNKSNVIQVEQSKVSQWITLAISVGLSLYLGFFVSSGVALYWIISNLFAIAQLYLLNIMINPKKYVDYKLLEESKNALSELEKIGNNDNSRKSEYRKKEREDYKRFFSVVNKHVVFYSESKGFYKYFRGLIDYLLDKTNIIIHYITSDPEDNIFNLAKENNRIRAYYIGEKRLITLMMKMDADMVLMTVPDLDQFHIKRSYVRKDVEYVFVQHGPGSVNMLFRKGALDNFDTVFCESKTQKEEILAQEKCYGLNHKKLIEVGSLVQDDMIEAYKNVKQSDDRYILIAPSWQADNIIDLCLDELLNEIRKTSYKVIVRPHPQHVRHMRGKLEQMRDKYINDDRITFQLDFSSTDTVWNAYLLITDWSDISIEYAFCTHRPVIFINTPMKIINPDYKDIDIVPFEIEIREKIGKSIDLNNLDSLHIVVDNLLKDIDEYRNNIIAYQEGQIYNIGHSASVGGKYIVDSLKERLREKNVKK